MHNLRTDRSTTSRLLDATEPMDSEIEKYLRALRDAQMPAMARALELLPTMDFPQSGTLVPELARLYKLLIEEQKQFWEDVAKPKDQRRAGLPKEYMETTQGLLDVLDKLSNTLAATVNHQDADDRPAAVDQAERLAAAQHRGRRLADRLDRACRRQDHAGSPLQLYPICRRHERDVEGAGVVDLGHAVAAGARLRDGRRQDRLFRSAISGLARPPRGRAGQGREGRDDGEPMEPAHGRPHGERGRGRRSARSMPPRCTRWSSAAPRSAH